MKKTIFILNILLSTLIFAQNPKPLTQSEKAYNDLISYVPKNFITDSLYRPESPLLRTGLNTIGKLKMYEHFKNEFKLTDTDKKWLEKRIDQIATALFLDGKRILISAVGGYSGCPKKMINTIRLNYIVITNLNFCNTCTDFDKDIKFIEIFNNRMYSLMGIQPPNYRTQLLTGKYKGIGKANLGMELILTKDREFKFWLKKGHSSHFTQGIWKNKNGFLILNSKNLNRTDSLSYSLSSASWIEFNNLEWEIKDDKLKEKQKGKWKLKKLND